ITGDAARGAQCKVAYVPDTRREALVLDLTIAKNASFLRMHEPGFQRYGLRLGAAEERYGERICKEFDVRPPQPQLLAAGVSGGNQQKLMVGREIASEPSVIVAHGPTQGLDLIASAAIRSRLMTAAENGAAVVVISADLDEILTISDRIVVLAAGRITDTIDVLYGNVDMVRLGRAMTDAAPAAATA